MTILLPSLAVLIPILTLPFWLFYFDITPKIAALLAGVGIALLIFPWRLASVRNFVGTSTGRKLTLLLALQMAALATSTLVSGNQALSLGGSNWRMYGVLTQAALLLFMLFTAAAFAAADVPIAYLLRSIAISGSLIAIYAILQYFGWDPLLPSITYHIGEGEWTIVRPPGTIGHADYLGSYLVFEVFLGGSLLWSEADRRWRIVGLVTILAGSFAIVLSGTRSAMAGLAAGAILLVIKFRPSRKQTIAVTVLGAALLGGFYFSPLGLKLRGRARWVREDPAGGARLYLWRDSLQMSMARPIAGWGSEMFSSEFGRFQSLALARAYPDFYHESPHNVFLDEIVAKGFAGALPFLAWCALAVIAAWKALRSSVPEAMIGAALLAGLVTLQFNAFVLTTAFFLFLTSVLLLAPVQADQPATKPFWLAALAGVPLGALFLYVAARLVFADVLLFAVRTQTEAGNIVAAAAMHEKVRQWDPRVGSSDLYYSRSVAPLVRRQTDLLHSVKAWQEGVQAGIRATAGAEDRQNAYYHLASLYAQVNNRTDTERSLRGAIACAPNWFKPHWMLAQVLQASGRHDAALAEAQTALDLDAGKHPEVVETLRKLGATK